MAKEKIVFKQMIQECNIPYIIDKKDISCSVLYYLDSSCAEWESYEGNRPQKGGSE
jgi:hypothetical protein